MNLKDNLKNKYIAYLDVLGFTELVNSEKIERLELYFQKIQRTLAELKGEKKSIDSLLISDSTILISPDTTEDFITLVTAVQTIQAELALIGIFIRGSISYGKVHFAHETNLIVGKGLINAYLLEKEAKYPRVIIDPQIVPKIAANGQGFLMRVNPPHDEYNPRLKLVHTWSKHTPNDSFFVSYGHLLIIDALPTRTIEIIYNLVIDNLYSSQKHYEKYLWVKNYLLDVLRDLQESWKYSNTKEGHLQMNYINQCSQYFAEM